MSKGLGKIERELLSILQQSPRGVATRSLAALVANPDGPTPRGCWPLTAAQYASVRRALLSLCKKRLAFRLHRLRSGEEQWAARDGALAYAKRLRTAFGDSAFDTPDLHALLVLMFDCDKPPGAAV